MAIDEFVAYCIIVIFWVFIAFPILFNARNETYKDMCILSLKVNLMGVATFAIFTSVLWAINKVLS